MPKMPNTNRPKRKTNTKQMNMSRDMRISCNSRDSKKRGEMGIKQTVMVKQMKIIQMMIQM